MFYGLWWWFGNYFMTDLARIYRSKQVFLVFPIQFFFLFRLSSSFSIIGMFVKKYPKQMFVWQIARAQNRFLVRFMRKVSYWWTSGFSIKVFFSSLFAKNLRVNRKKNILDALLIIINFDSNGNNLRINWIINWIDKTRALFLAPMPQMSLDFRFERPPRQPFVHCSPDRTKLKNIRI